jgi:hypothetical protein
LCLTQHKLLYVLNLCLLALKLTQIVPESPGLLFEISLQQVECLSQELVEAFLNLVGVTLELPHQLNEVLHVLFESPLLVFQVLVSRCHHSKRGLICLLKLFHCVLEVLVT